LVSDSKEDRRLKVFENRLLRRISGPKRDEMAGGWRKLLNENLHNFYSPPNVIRVIKSRKVRWAGRVAYMGETRDAYKMLLGKAGGRNHYEVLDIVG
jgi:hypothetical protein